MHARTAIASLLLLDEKPVQAIQGQFVIVTTGSGYPIFYPVSALSTHTHRPSTGPFGPSHALALAHH